PFEGDRQGHELHEPAGRRRGGPRDRKGSEAACKAHEQGRLGDIHHPRQEGRLDPVPRDQDRLCAGNDDLQSQVERAPQRTPPRSKCAWKKSSAPAVAIAAEAEISRHSVAAATIWASRYTLPAPSQPMRRSQLRAYGEGVPPPTVATSSPGSRIATCRPSSTR